MKPTIILKANSKVEKLPFASLSCISGIPLIVICAKRLANTGFDVVVATSNLNNHNELVNILKKFKLQYFRATSKNVFKEFLKLKKNVTMFNFQMFNLKNRNVLTFMQTLKILMTYR